MVAVAALADGVLLSLLALVHEAELLLVVVAVAALAAGVLSPLVIIDPAQTSFVIIRTVRGALGGALHLRLFCSDGGDISVSKIETSNSSSWGINGGIIC